MKEQMKTLLKAALPFLTPAVLILIFVKLSLLEKKVDHLQGQVDQLEILMVQVQIKTSMFEDKFFEYMNQAYGQLYGVMESILQLFGGSKV